VVFKGKELTGVVLGGGKGLNMEPLTPHVHKTLIRILGKPLIFYPTHSLIKLGIMRIHVISKDPGKYASELSQFLDEPVDHVGQLGDSFEDALVTATELADRGTMILSFGDVIMPREAYELALTSHLSSGRPVTILTVPVPDLAGYFEVKSLDDNVEVMKVSEHRPGYALGGVVVMEREFAATLRDVNGDLNSALSRHKANRALWSGWFVDITYPWDLLAAVRNMLSTLSEARISSGADVSPSAVVEGAVIIDEGARVDHGAVVRGPVYIGKGVYVGNNALVRNNSSLEEKSLVGAGAEVTETLVGPGATVGRGSFVGSSVLGNESIVEPGVVTLSVLPSGVEISHLAPVVVKGKALSKLGMIVGPRARIGANSVIYPGTVIEANRYVQPLSTIRGGTY